MFEIQCSSDFDSFFFPKVRISTELFCSTEERGNCIIFLSVIKVSFL